VFLDRDGVINENRRDYVRSLEQWVPIPGAFQAMASLCAAGHPLVVVTNQSGIARGYIAESELRRIHSAMEEMLLGAGGSFASIRYCPHGPWDGCGCRKPETGMIRDARRELGLPGTGGWIVGDADSDMEMGRRAGLRTVLVLTGRGRAQLELIRENRSPEPDHVVEDLKAAARVILA